MKKIKLKNCVSSSVLTHMREVAYNSFTNGTQDIIERAERMRDDAGLLEAAELKRQRKLMKAKQNIKKLKESYYD